MRGKVVFKIKPYTHQRHLDHSNKTLCAPGDPTETESDMPLSVCLSWSYGAAVAYHRGRALGAADLVVA